MSQRWQIFAAFIAVLFCGTWLMTHSATAANNTPAKPARYSTQFQVVMPTMTVLAVTDNETNTLYVYTNEKDDLKLVQSADLNQVGQPFIKSTMPKSPTTKPAN